MSIIVPIYNQEKLLARAVKSLLGQDISTEEMEILLVDDGSTDASAQMCDAYAQDYSNIRVVHQQNGGLSNARNRGIAEARGSYLMFLDPDDYLGANTVLHVIDFFDKHYDEVDLVTYPSISIKPDGTEKARHYRYTVLQNSGIYDLLKPQNIYAAVTRIEVCVKNPRYWDVPYCKFSEDREFRQEDQKYCTEVILPKLKIGYCAQAGPYYYEQNPEGLQNSRFFSFFLNIQ